MKMRLRFVIFCLSLYFLWGCTSSQDASRDCLSGKVVFTMSTGGESSIYVADLNTQRQERLTNGQSLNTQPKWSPSGSSIVFVSYRDGNAEIYKMGSDGSAITRLTQNPADDLEPVWSPDGHNIAFVRFVNKIAQIFIMDPTGNDVKQITSEDFDSFDPSWSPDGKEIIFVSDHKTEMDFGHPALYTVNLMSGAQERIGKDVLGYAPAWAPNGRFILYVSDIKSIRRSLDRILIHDVQSKDSSLLIPGDVGSSQEAGISYYNPVWSKNGNCVIFLQDRGGANVNLIYFADRKRAIINGLENIEQLDWVTK